MNIIEEYNKGNRDFSYADLSGANLKSSNLKNANLSGANLKNANLSGANLSGADLSGANLPRANLSSANLESADLFGANLFRANLSAAHLSRVSFFGAVLCKANFGNQWVIQGPVRSDGHAFFLQRLTGESEPMVRAGCRYFTIRGARKHWGNAAYPNTKLAQESLAILDCLEKLAQIRHGIGE